MQEKEKKGLDNRTKEKIIIVLAIVLIILIIVLLCTKKESGNQNKFKEYRAEGYEKIVKEDVGPMNGIDNIYYVFDNYIAKRSNLFYSEDSEKKLKEEGSIVFYYFDDNIDKYNKWKEEGYNDIESMIAESSSEKVYAEYKIKR